MMSSESYQAPLQLKGEIMDLEFTLDTDHRKRRRNRTTQSCLNCHTSKRKCDRKRPCQRCIQLGLTGLCVYEIDDPSLRDDPSVDENTRLRNRIAELESLVRELRGKPHPRWAESNFRDGDPNEKWHSRAAKCAPQVKRRGHTPDIIDENSSRNHRSVISALLTPIKTENAVEMAQSRLYRFSPSPPPSGRYPNVQGDSRSLTGTSFEQQQRHSYSDPPSSGGSAGSYQSTSSAHAMHYRNHSMGSYPEINGATSYNVPGDERVYADQYAADPMSPQGLCPCRTAPTTAHALYLLLQHLQNSINALRQQTHHPQNSPCLIYRRVIELSNLLHADAGDAPGPSYDGLSTPTDTEILTPISATSSHPSFHGSSGGRSPQEWQTLSAAGYNPYFPLPPGDHGIYNNVIS